MSEDNPGRFYRPEDFDGDENSDNWTPEQQLGKELYLKAIDILNLTETIGSMLPDVENEKSESAFTRQLMMENAMIIAPRIRGAMAVDTYSIRMENAVMIKVNICQLQLQLCSCETMHGLDSKYIDVMRQEIEAFRRVFIKWIGLFDKENDLPDEWHLFNDPSTFPQDDDTFGPDEFFDED